MTVLYGLSTRSDSEEEAIRIASELDAVAGGEEWSMVMFTLNQSTYAIISSSLAVKGKVMQIKGVDIVTLGEAAEAAYDSRSRWILPRKRANGSQQELAIAKVKGLLNASIGGNVGVEQNIGQHPVKEKVTLAPIKRKRLGGETKESLQKKRDAEQATQEQSLNGEIARTSRR